TGVPGPPPNVPPPLWKCRPGSDCTSGRPEPTFESWLAAGTVVSSAGAAVARPFSPSKSCTVAPLWNAAISPASFVSTIDADHADPDASNKTGTAKAMRANAGMRPSSRLTPTRLCRSAGRAWRRPRARRRARRVATGSLRPEVARDQVLLGASLARRAEPGGLAGREAASEAVGDLLRLGPLEQLQDERAARAQERGDERLDRLEQRFLAGAVGRADAGELRRGVGEHDVGRPPERVEKS